MTSAVRLEEPVSVPHAVKEARPQERSPATPHNPYLAARREWDERYGNLITRERHRAAKRPQNPERPRALNGQPINPPQSQPSVVTNSPSDALRNGGTVENTSNILTIKEVAAILRCSKAHALNVIDGNVRGLPKLTHLSLGRRKVVRKDWLDQWMEANKTR